VNDKRGQGGFADRQADGRALGTALVDRGHSPTSFSAVGQFYEDRRETSGEAAIALLDAT